MSTRKDRTKQLQSLTAELIRVVASRFIVHAKGRGSQPSLLLLVRLVGVIDFEYVVADNQAHGDDAERVLLRYAPQEGLGQSSGSTMEREE
jgi:hypothetical protein